MTQYDNIPRVLKQLTLFCCWRYEKRKGDLTKVPYDPVTRRRAEIDMPETFRDFNTCLAVISKYDGIGIRVGDGVCAIDVDDCFDENDGLKPYAQDIADMFSGCYMERSPSGKGLRIIFKATGYVYDKAKYYINNRPRGLEVYVAGVTNRFVTLTGNVYRHGDVVGKSEALQAILDKYMQRPVYIQKEIFQKDIHIYPMRLFSRWQHLQQTGVSLKPCGAATPAAMDPRAKQIWRSVPYWLSGAVGMSGKWTGCFGNPG